MEDIVQPIRRPVTMKDQVYEALRTLILNGRLEPGQPLVEAQLAAQLGTSKTPLREAFLHLEADGLVTLLPHKGASVTYLSLQELREAQFVRLALEIAAFLLTVEHISPGELALARRHLMEMQMMVQRGDWDTYRRAHREFHCVLAEATRNMVLAKLLLDLFDRLQRYSQFCLQGNAIHWRQDEQDHHETFAALERGDRETFATTFRRMNEQFRVYIEDALRQHNKQLERYFLDGLDGQRKRKK